MRSKIISIVVTGFAVSAWCCSSPGNLEGVAFTSGETLNLHNLTILGTENVNFFRDTSDTNVGIRYVSHYDSRAMVFVGTYGISYQKDLPLKCMGVFFPIDSLSQRIDTSNFYFARAVRAELEWLAEQKIVDISAAAIGVIDSALLISSNGGVQFWTHAGRALGYNSWYSYDTLMGNWGGVNAVRGVYGCSAINPGTNLPPQQLGSSGIKVPTVNAGESAGVGMKICHLKGRGILLDFSRPLEKTARLTVMNCKGEVVIEMTLPGGVRKWNIARNIFNSPGYYTAEIASQKVISKAPFVIVR